MSAPSISAAPYTRSVRGRFDRSAFPAVIRATLPVQITSLGADEVEASISTGTRARDGHVLVPQGARLENYRANPIVLWNHDADCPPIGRAEGIRVDSQQIAARIRFAAGITDLATEVRDLVKAGFLNGISVGFNPLDGEPIDARNSRAGVRFTDWELLEISFCNIPVDTGAAVTARAYAGGAAPATFRQRSHNVDGANQHLRAAQQAEQLIAERCRSAFEAFARDDHSTVHRCLRAIESHVSNLGIANDARARALGADTGYVDPTKNPDGQGGAQVSKGQVARGLSYEERQAERRRLAVTP